MNFLRLEALATMGLNCFEPVQPPTDKSTFVLLACACSTTLGRDDSTAQSSGNEGRLSGLFKMANAMEKCWRIHREAEQAVHLTIIDVSVFIEWDVFHWIIGIQPIGKVSIKCWFQWPLYSCNIC